MTEFRDIATNEVLTGVNEANHSVIRGQGAQGVLADPVVAEFIPKRVRVIVDLLLEVDAADARAVTAAVLALQALYAFHSSLTQAVTDGLTAAMRLSEQAKQGEAK